MTGDTCASTCWTLHHVATVASLVADLRLSRPPTHSPLLLHTVKWHLASGCSCQMPSASRRCHRRSAFSAPTCPFSSFDARTSRRWAPRCSCRIPDADFLLRRSRADASRACIFLPRAVLGVLGGPSADTCTAFHRRCGLSTSSSRVNQTRTRSHRSFGNQRSCQDQALTWKNSGT